MPSVPNAALQAGEITAQGMSVLALQQAFPAVIAVVPSCGDLGLPASRATLAASQLVTMVLQWPRVHSKGSRRSSLNPRPQGQAPSEPSPAWLRRSCTALLGGRAAAMFCSFEAAACRMCLTEQGLGLPAQVATTATSKGPCEPPDGLLPSPAKGKRRQGGRCRFCG